MQWQHQNWTESFVNYEYHWLNLLNEVLEYFPMKICCYSEFWCYFGFQSQHDRVIYNVPYDAMEGYFCDDDLQRCLLIF